jgi:hypothetical protein
MKKLAFLIGKWSGDATSRRGQNETVKVKQTEEVQFKLDGLVLLIEGTGRDPNSGDVISMRWRQLPTMRPLRSTISGRITMDDIWTRS